MNIAIVTGASSGMGREFVLQLQQYAQVDEIWAIARREQALASLKEEVSVPVRAISLDLLKEESFTAFSSCWKRKSPTLSFWSMPRASASSVLTIRFLWKMTAG